MRRATHVASLAPLFAAALILPQIASAQSAGMPPADAQALWNYLEKQDYRKSFQLFPGKGTFYEGVEPHAPLLTTYVNEAAARALTQTEGKLPAGSILVKENYRRDKTLAATTVMYKVEGYAPEDGNWFWLKRTADGRIEEAGKVPSCTRCHYKGLQDYVLTPVKK